MPAKILLVGINDYAPAGPGGPDLRGCVNDVRDAWDTFVNVLALAPPLPGFVRVLTDRRATRAAILDGVKWLLTPRDAIERAIFYYSGHGSWMVDPHFDDVDGRDETICPHDYATAGMIVDDELRKLFAAVKPGFTLETIFDSCHSGTATRDTALAREMREVEPELRVRFIEPPLDYSIYGDSSELVVRGMLRSTATRQTVLVPGMNHVHWAACRDNQTAAEAPIGGVPRGIFSYCFFKALRRAGLGIVRRQLETIVTSAVHRLGYNQEPQLEGNRAEILQPVFRELKGKEKPAAAAAIG